MARSQHSSVSAARVAAPRLPALARLGFALAIALGSSPAFAQSICNQTGGVAPVATGGSAFACGDTAVAGGGASLAVGTQANSSGSSATAVGTESVASGDFGSAFGREAKATVEGSTALGFNSSATAENAVALGANSVANEADTVSVGAAGAERKVTNVAAGTNDTDAVNVSQLNDTAATTLDSANTYTDQSVGDTLAAANTYTDQQISLLGAGGGVASADLEQLRTDMNDRFAGVDGRLNGIDEHLRKMDRRIGRQGAMTAALVQSSGMPDVGENYLGVGVGWSEGENAFAASFRRRFTEHFTASVGGATSGNESSIGVGAGFTWGGD